MGSVVTPILETLESFDRPMTSRDLSLVIHGDDTRHNIDRIAKGCGRLERSGYIERVGIVRRPDGAHAVVWSIKHLEETS